MPTVYHIPVCPFSQRLEILLTLKGIAEVQFQVVDITKPRPQSLLDKTRGSTPLPVLETEGGTILRESLVLLRYFDERYPEQPVAQKTPERRAVENMLIAQEGDFGNWGYRYVMNQDPAQREALRRGMEERYARLSDFLEVYATGDPFLFENFGLAEVVFTPLFMRFWFLEYYESFELPAEPRFERVRRWRQACLEHPAAQQVNREQIVKLYYDYSQGAGNGALPAGRTRSSFVFEPDYHSRPWPPPDKYGHHATDAELGL
jgi:glutathione S-transferase